MQKVEHAIGEADTRSWGAPVRQARLELAPIEYDLLLGGQRRGRQDARPQFGGRDGGGAALADDDGRGGVGRAHRGFVIGVKRQHDRKHRGDRVAGARHVTHPY